MKWGAENHSAGHNLAAYYALQAALKLYWIKRSEQTHASGRSQRTSRPRGDLIFYLGPATMTYNTHQLALRNQDHAA